MTTVPQHTTLELLLMSDFGRLRPEHARMLAQRACEPVKQPEQSPAAKRERDE